MRILLFACLMAMLCPMVKGQPTLQVDDQGSKSKAKQLPIDDVVEDHTILEKRLLPYPNQRESDILWKKIVWREIDTREKMNLVFRNPKMSLVSILNDAVLSGELQAYNAETDDFSIPLTKEELDQQLYEIDTVEVLNPITYDPEFQEIKNDFDPADVIRFRMKEVWYFDSNTSTMKVRIIGIAPLKDVYDDGGNYRYTLPMYWINYAQARTVLAKQAIQLAENDKKVMSWEDILEMRFFSSYITKESNTMDERLQDQYSGLNLLHQSEKIKNKIQNKEQDMWSY